MAAKFWLGVHFEVPEAVLEANEAKLEAESEHLEHEIRIETEPLSLQLYSEYRSTYKWHEFTPNNSASLPGASASTASAAASASNNEVVVKKPPKPITGENFYFLLGKHVFFGKGIHCVN